MERLVVFCESVLQPMHSFEVLLLDDEKGEEFILKN